VLYTESNSWGKVTDFVPSPAAAGVTAYLIASFYWADKKPLSTLWDFSKTRL
jgi:hypothetical protein